MADTPPFLAWLAHLLTLPAEVDEMKINQLRLEHIMAQVDEALAALNDATNEVAGELDALEAKVAELEAAAGQADANVAGQIRAAADRLRGLAVDPENPVPAEPEPSPEPEQPAEPTPAEPADPNAPVEGDQPA